MTGTRAASDASPIRYPFSAVVGHDRLKLALILSAISPGIGGVLIRGEKGTAKSTIVRGLGPLLDDGADGHGRVVELPIGATEDRVIGSLDLTAVLSEGRAEFTPGLLARADGGVLYIDEVNLLADHLVDVLLDAAASGRVTIERDGVSHTQSADFVLVGTMNPEEGELRPQLLDRFGLAVDVAAGRDIDERVAVIRRRMEFDSDPEGFVTSFAEAEDTLKRRIAAARAVVSRVTLSTAELRRIAGICAHLEVDGLRGDIVVARTAAAHAAWRQADAVTADDVRVAVELALPHRRRRNPFDESGLTADQLDDAMESGAEAADASGPDGDPDPTDPGPGGSPPDAPDTAQDTGPEAAKTPASEVDTEPTETTTPADDPAPAPAAGGARFGSPRIGDAVRRMTRLRVDGLGDGDPGRRSLARSRRGQTTRAVDFAAGAPVHLFGTVLSAAGRVEDRDTGVAATLRVGSDDLRAAERIGQEGNLVVFLVDLSGSMTARRRLTAVTELCVDLLRDSYTRRDRVAVVVARGSSATVVVPPTRSVDIAVRRLAEVRTGGRTPLAEGLRTAADLVDRAVRREPRRRPLLVVLTDGRATSGPDAAIRARCAATEIGRKGVESVVVDCEQGMIRLGLAAELAVALGARCLPMDDLTARALTGPGRAA
ncbi:VWA domain-containing protein [Gordonia rhizosphera]|uniref:Putative magnesium chelatase subunit n=1 Tax=Gordonia rhizosphera NBRC 16068 TaxID=1108045 RepID=K6W563_9ACTN|nr:VWA domain-containing protein [Gordonia rhizosphera]GAB88821.1 putative magnesium chelatase subunit [Gordonia rhizosphera NBRC 16068]